MGCLRAIVILFLLGAEAEAKEPLLSCSFDGRGAPNAFGVCVEFPADTERPGFYCTDEMRISYIPCARRERVGSCEMTSESGPFIVHYYAPQRQGSSLEAFCASRGKYHAPNSGFSLSLARKPAAKLDPDGILAQTKEAAAWQEPAAKKTEFCENPGVLRELYARAPASAAQGSCENFAVSNATDSALAMTVCARKQAGGSVEELERELYRDRCSQK